MNILYKNLDINNYPEINSLLYYILLEHIIYKIHIFIKNTITINNRKRKRDEIGNNNNNNNNNNKKRKLKDVQKNPLKRKREE